MWWNSPKVNGFMGRGEKEKGAAKEVAVKKVAFEDSMIDSRFGHGEFVLLIFN